MNTKVRYQNREEESGRYTFEGGLERLCICGHTLGIHSAARVRHNGKSYQDCLIYSFQAGTPENPKGEKCNCSCFKPKK